MFNKLRNRLLLINMIVISVIMYIAFSLIYTVTSNQIDNENVNKLRKIPLSSIEISTENNMLNEELYELLKEEGTSFNLLLNEDKEIERTNLHMNYDDEVYENLVSLLDFNEKTGEITYEEITYLYEISNINRLIKEIELSNEIEYRITFLDITEDKNLLEFLLLTLIIISVIMLIIIYFISIYFSNKSIKPLEIMWNKQKQFVADASHELKTPLTIINANTDLILMNSNQKVSTQRKWLEYIKSESKGMNKLVTELLNSAKAEEEKYNFNTHNLSRVTEDLILSFETIIYEKNVKLSSKIEDNIKVNTDAEKYKQALAILLDNAIKYTEKDGKINIELIKTKRNIEFKIDNTGSGISKEDLPHIFERFYKSDKARTNNNSNSYGLGLYIAKTIVNKLNGSIECKSDENKTIFVIKLKK